MLMRYHELFEQVYYSGDFKAPYDTVGVNLTVLKNPSKAEVQRMLNRALGKPKELRGILTDDTLYLWDAYLASHHSVKQVFQLEGMHVYFYEDNYFKIDDYHWRHPDMKSAALEYIETNSLIGRLFPNTKFIEDPSRGFIFTY